MQTLLPSLSASNVVNINPNTNPNYNPNSGKKIQQNVRALRTVVEERLW